MISEVNKLIIGTRLRDMFRKGWFSICCIDDCLNLAGILPGGESYRQLKALHCVQFGDMPRELAEAIPSMIRDVFDGVSIDQLMQASTPALANTGKKTVAGWLTQH